MIKVINLVALIIAPIVVTIDPGNPVVLGAMVLCLIALIWAIWQSKRESNKVAAPEAQVKVA